MERLISLKEALKVIPIGYNHACELARTGVLPVIRIGRRFFLSPERLQEYLDKGGKGLPGGWRKNPDSNQQAAA